MAISTGAGMAIAAAIAAAGKMYSGYAGSRASQASATDQYIYNMALQKQAQAWSEKMANTAHQREVQDLKMAGLNPILSANGGAPVGSAGTNSVSMDNRAQGIEEATSGLTDFTNAMLQNRANDIDQQNADTNEGLAGSEKVVNEQKAELLKNQAQNELIDGEIKNQHKLQEILKTEWLPKWLKKELEKSSSEITRNLTDAMKSRAETLESGARKAEAEARTQTEYSNARNVEKDIEKKNVEIERLKDTPTQTDHYGIKGPFGVGIDITRNTGKPREREYHYEYEKLKNGKIRKVKVMD